MTPMDTLQFFVSTKFHFDETIILARLVSFVDAVVKLVASRHFLNRRLKNGLLPVDAGAGGHFCGHRSLSWPSYFSFWLILLISNVPHQNYTLFSCPTTDQGRIPIARGPRQFGGAGPPNP